MTLLLSVGKYIIESSEGNGVARLQGDCQSIQRGRDSCKSGLRPREVFNFKTQYSCLESAGNSAQIKGEASLVRLVESSSAQGCGNGGNSHAMGRNRVGGSEMG